MPDIKIINPNDYPGWDDMLLSSKDYSFFHTSVWGKVLCESYNYTGFYFSIFNHGQLAVSIPVMEIKSILTGKRGVSLPFTDDCEPIIMDDVPAQALIDFIKAYGIKQGWEYLEFRGRHSCFDEEISSANYFGHVLDLLRKEKDIFSNFRKGTKSAIKQAMAEDVGAKISNSLEAVNEFYKLNCITRRRHGLPPQPYHFFKNVYDHIISKDLGVVVLGSFRNNPIAGGVFFHFGKKAIYKYGASDINYQHLRPNNLIIWEAIKWYTERGYKSFCFGRTEAENQGLRIFKNGWGTDERIIKYYKYDLRSSRFVARSNGTNNLYGKLLSRAPIALLKPIGSLLYRHMG